MMPRAGSLVYVKGFPNMLDQLISNWQAAIAKHEDAVIAKCRADTDLKSATDRYGEIITEMATARRCIQHDVTRRVQPEARHLTTIGRAAVLRKCTERAGAALSVCEETLQGYSDALENARKAFFDQVEREAIEKDSK